MDHSQQFVWSIRAHRVATALRLDGPLDDELAGYGETLLTVVSNPKECSVFATELRPIWYAVLQRSRYMPPQIIKWEGPHPDMADLFERLSKRLLSELSVFSEEF